MDDPVAAEPWPRADWHAARLAAFLQDGGRVGIVVCPSAEGRTAVLDGALRLMPWPVIRAGNPLASPLTLYRLLIQVGAEDDGGDEGDSLLRRLAGHAAGSEPGILLVNDAHSLADDVLLALARIPGLAGPDRPGVALILAGGLALPGMLSGPGLESLRDAATTMTLMAPGVSPGGVAVCDAPAPVAGRVPILGSNPVPLPPARAEQVFHAPIDHGIVQIPMPSVRPSLVVDPPAAGAVVQIPMPDVPKFVVPPVALIASPGPIAPPGPIWARPSAAGPSGLSDVEHQHRPYLARIAVEETLAATPRIATPGGAPVLAAELVSPPSEIDEHIMGVRSHMNETRPAPVHRVWLAVAAVSVAAAAAGGSMLAWRLGHGAGPAAPVPAVVMAPASAPGPMVRAPGTPPPAALPKPVVAGPSGGLSAGPFGGPSGGPSEGPAPVVRPPPRPAPLPRQPDAAR